MPAARVLWHALVGLYDETVTLVAGNLLWIALNLPLYLLLVLVAVPFFGTGWLLVVLAWLLVYLPTPASVALGGLTRVAAGPDVPRLSLFLEALRLRWRLALACCAVSLAGFILIVVNLYFYAAMNSGWLQAAAILWLYLGAFWLGMHVYLVPLIHHVEKPRLQDLYRRAALIALGHAPYTLLVALALLVVGLVGVIFLPAYVLVGGAYVSLAQAHAFREVRRRHGDLLVEPDEKGSL
jgi:uncharacterized membrane protein YesL